MLLEKANRIGSGVKSRATVFKDRMVDYIANPPATREPEPIRHVKSKDRGKGKAYRNSEFMFSIDDEENVQSGEFLSVTPMFQSSGRHGWVSRVCTCPNSSLPVC